MIQIQQKNGELPPESSSLIMVVKISRWPTSERVCVNSRSESKLSVDVPFNSGDLKRGHMMKLSCENNDDGAHPHLNSREVMKRDRFCGRAYSSLGVNP